LTCVIKLPIKNIVSSHMCQRNGSTMKRVEHMNHKALLMWSLCVLFI